MSYRIRRIDPFWMPNLAVLATAGGGLVICLFGLSLANQLLTISGAVLLAGGVLVATKPAISAVMGTLGILGGLVTFLMKPDASLAGLPILWRLVSALFFSILYMVLMDALVLVVCSLYNLFGGTLNLGGIHMDIEDTGDPGNT